MVAIANADLYSPFSQGMSLEDGQQSSSEGSGLQSPSYVGASFPPPHGNNNLRYNHDLNNIQHAAGILPPELAFNLQSSPLLDVTIDSSKSSARHHHTNYPSEVHLPSRNQLPLNFPVHLPAISRLPSFPPSTGQSDFTFQTSSARRFPGGGQLNDPTYAEPRPSVQRMSSDGDQRPSSSSTERSQHHPDTPASSSRHPRKEISTVVIACRQCRARKIRCDSTRPICNNCVRRSNECQYDAVPKRRGPDKRPGTRQRSCKKRPADGSAPPPPSKRKRPTAIHRSDETPPAAIRIKDDKSSPKHSPPIQPRPSDRIEDGRVLSQSHHASSLPPSRIPPSRHTQSTSSHSSPLVRYNSDPFVAHSADMDRAGSEHCDTDEKMFGLPLSPSLEYNQKMWWDNFLRTYSTSKEQSLKDIIADLTTLFNSTSYWLSFVNPFFIQSLYTDERLRIQPSFILAGLALATLLQSSEVELGSTGRSRAIWLRDGAQASLEAAWNSQRIEPTLAEAALILALFESSAHPDYSPERETSSLVFLDNIIRALSLTYLDANDPIASRFSPGTVPVVHSVSVDTIPTSNKEGGRINHNDRDKKCSCIPPNTPLSPDHFSSNWLNALPWDASWGPSEVQKEEYRRLCWSALNLVASYTSQCVLFNREPPDLFLSDPANFALLFPGEAMDRPSTSSSYHSSQTLSAKESVWALYCRSMLLWNFCTRLRKDTCPESEKAEYALEAWVETQAIQDSLDMHVCNLNTALMYMAREYIYNTRMTITQALRSLQGLDSGTSPLPVFNRKQAEEWLYYQDQVVKRVKVSVQHLNNPQGYLLTRRPFQVVWFCNQLAICLALWERDRSLLNALELAKSILIPLDVLNALWPCPLQRSRSNELRERLADACTTVGLPPPLPAGFSLPPLLRSR